MFVNARPVEYSCQWIASRIFGEAAKGAVQVSRGFVCRRSVGLPSLIVLALTAWNSPVLAEQWRVGGQVVASGGMHGFAPPTIASDGVGTEGGIDPAARQEKRMRWLKSANGNLGVEQDSTRAQGGRINGLSREERHRLRSDIRDAGYTVYSPNYPTAGFQGTTVPPPRREQDGQ